MHKLLFVQFSVVVCKKHVLKMERGKKKKKKRRKPHLKPLIFKDFKPTSSKLVQTDLATCLGNFHARIVPIDARGTRHSERLLEMKQGQSFCWLQRGPGWY